MTNLIQKCFVSLSCLACIAVAQAQTGAAPPSKAAEGKPRCAQIGKSVECSDTALFYLEGRKLVREAFMFGRFDEAEALFEKWISGTDRFPDGRWKLSMYEEGLERYFEDLDQAEEVTLAKIQRWQQLFPDSFAAKYAEALYWRQAAWKARGQYYANTVTKEGWVLFRERLAKADAILTKLEPKAVRYPTWYHVRIANLIEQGRQDEAEKVYKEGQARFPDSHYIYLQMARAHQPKWGGSREAFDKFAREVAKHTAALEGNGMYARLYWMVDYTTDIPLESEQSKYPSWKLLKSGFEDLEKHYPGSIHNRRKYAAFACRSNESALYRKLRSEISVYAGVGEAFTVVPVDACDLRHGWPPKR
jgi:hypothetical protein